MFKFNTVSIAFFPIILVSIWIYLPGFQSQSLAQNRIDTIAETGEPAPDGNGAYSSFSAPVLNDEGQAAFFAQLDFTSGGTTDDSGLFLGSGGSVPNVQIAREGQTSPDGNGDFSSFTFPLLNNSGEVAFIGSLAGTSGGTTDDGGIFRSNSASGITQIAREGQAVPNGNGVYSSFNGLDFNVAGQSVFKSFLAGTSGGTADDEGIFLSDGSSVIQIAREGQTAPDGNGSFEFFGGPRLNNIGQAAFRAQLRDTTGGTADSRGVFRSGGSTITQIARAGQLAPDSNGALFSFDAVELNDVGQVAFKGLLTGTSNGSSDNTGIFRGSGGVLTQIAREGQTTPDGNGVFSLFASDFFPQIKINNPGQVAFSAILDGTSGGTTDDTGIFLGSGVEITQIVREGQLAPDSNGTFSSFFDSVPALNDSGQSAFTNLLNGTSGGNNDNFGLFTGDGIDLLQVIREGDSLVGSTVTNISFSSSGLNELGQIAYRAALANGREIIQRWTPDLHYRSASSGNWDDNRNWTLSLNPGQVHDVFIDPADSLTVAGPFGAVSVRSLQVGSTVGGNATLDLVGGNIQSESGVQIFANGRLTGTGQITRTSTGAAVSNGGLILPENITVNGDVSNFGEIGGNGRLAVNGTLFNQFNVKGNVTVSATGGITNASTGQFRVGHGESMLVDGFFNTFNNQGTLEVIQGELEIRGPATNVANTGFIALRDATIRFNDGQLNSGLTNEGSIGITFGTTDVFGDINNTSTGVINLSGGANATFYDDVVQNGTLQVAALGNTSSTAVFFGEFSGTGGFSGGGDVYALGDLRPGASPASVLMEGNLFLGASTNTLIELGGLDIGQFDQLLVTGDLFLDGDLTVSLIDDFHLELNQEFLVADVGGDLTGSFDGLSEGSLVGNYGGYNLFISYTGGNGNDISLFTAIPEPGTSAILAISVTALLFSRRRRVRG
jgi:hypothetical protein